jgi:Leucine-rich repeat (LRR) protein
MTKKWYLGMLLFILPVFMSIMPSSFFVQAQDILQNQTGIVDFYLYNELLNLANQNRVEPLQTLQTDALNAVEEITITNSQIASLEGLHLLELNNLKRLNLSNNALTTISSQHLSGLTQLEELNLNFNTLTQIELSALQNLNVLQLQGNALNQINLSNIKAHVVNGNGYVNLKNNAFETLSQITLPSEQETAIIVDLNNNYLTSQNIASITQTHQLNLLVQGIKQNDSVLEGHLLEVYGADEYSEFNLKLTDSQDNFVLQLGEGSITPLLPGEYVLSYFNGDTPLYNATTKEPKEFAPVSFTVQLKKPTVQVMLGNQIVEKLPTYKEPITLQFTSFNQNATISYSINNGQWVQGNTVTLSTNGQYTVRAVSSLEASQSQILEVTLNINEPWQSTQSVLKAVASGTILILIFMGGYVYYKKRTI